MENSIKNYEEFYIDYSRKKRTGASEIIYGAGKTADQILNIIKDMRKNGQEEILVTRIDQNKYDQIKEEVQEFDYDIDARTLVWQKNPVIKNPEYVNIVCAGTSDLPVAKEAYNTALFLGNNVRLIADVGVAGIHRLFSKLDEILDCNVLVVCAGMEGALASVVGGLTDKPVIAVPTSVGYGANFQGLSALLSMLNSCASGVSVVNIDNGFGAGYMAHSINSLAK